MSIYAQSCSPHVNRQSFSRSMVDWSRRCSCNHHLLVQLLIPLWLIVLVAFLGCTCCQWHRLGIHPWRMNATTWGLQSLNQYRAIVSVECPFPSTSSGSWRVSSCIISLTLLFLTAGRTFFHSHGEADQWSGVSCQWPESFIHPLAQKECGDEQAAPGRVLAGMWLFFSIFWDFIVCFCWSLFQLLNVMQKSGKYIFCFAFYYNTTFDLNLRERVWNCTASLITGPSSNIQIHAISQSHVACFELLCIPVALELFLFQRMTFSGRLAIPLRSHHGSKWLLTRVSSFWASGGHRSGSASGSWTRLCSFTGIVTCDPQAQRRAEVCSGPLQEEAAWSQGQLGLIVFKDLPIRWLRGNWGGVPKEVWDAACLRIEYYWMQVASSSINVQVLAFFFACFYQASCDPCHLQFASHGSGTIGLLPWAGLCEAELAPTSSASAFLSSTVRQPHEVIWVISN